jgi:hypothetical protein
VSGRELRSPNLGNGLFTHYFLARLKGKTNLNRDGVATLKTLYDHVCQQTT